MHRTLLTAILAAFVATSAVALTPIQVDGNQIQGSIEATDTEYMPPSVFRSDAAYYRDVYTVDIPAAGMLDIFLESSFDGYLYLFDANGAEVTSNDDYQSTSTSRITTQITAPGLYHIVVTTYGTGATGNYTLTVSDRDPNAIEGAVIPGALEPTDTAPAAGSYDRSDPGYYRDIYPVPAQVGQMMTIDLVSEFDGYLYLIGPSGQVVAYDDDFGGTDRSRIENAIIQETGTHQIVVTSYSQGVTGAYTLTIGTPQDPPEPSPDVAVIIGMPTPGELTPDDNAMLPSIAGNRSEMGYFRDGYIFAGAPGLLVQIDTQYNGFDGYLYLIAPDGTIAGSNDDFQSTAASQISTTLEQVGNYRVVVATYSRGTSGTYTLTIGTPTSTPPVAAPQQPTSTPAPVPTAPNPWGATQQPAAPQQPAWSPAPLATPGQAPAQASAPAPGVVDHSSAVGSQEIPRLDINTTVRGNLVQGDRDQLPTSFARYGTYLNDRYDYIPPVPGQEHFVVEVICDFTSRVYLRDPFGGIIGRSERATPPNTPIVLEADLQYPAPYTTIISTEDENATGNYVLSFSNTGGMNPSL